METVFKHRKVGRIAAAGLVSGAAIWSAPLPVHAAVAPVTSVVFNNPNDAVRKKAVSDRLRMLIANADANSTIKVAIFQFQDPSITDALRRARSRGVSVQVIVDWGSTRYATWKYLSDPTLGGLGFDRTKSSWVFSCPASQACIGGTNAPEDVTPIMHNKFALFSSVGGARNVVFQSSANFKVDLPGGSGDGNWNNAVTTVGNAGLYNSYAGYFDDLKNLRRSTDYYNKRPPETFGPFRPYYSPRAGSGAGTDTIVSILNNVDCTKRNTSTGTSTRQTIVKVAMAHFTRGDVSEKLKQMDNAGCYVQVIYRDDTVGAAVKADLLDKSGRYNGIQSWRFPKSAVHTLHSKYLAIEGYYGASDQKVVWTGSHNYTRPALRYNDEVLLRVTGASFHDAFRQNFRDMAYGAPGILANP